MATILLVEDNEANRDMLSRRLERRGYAVTIATDGRDGIEAARRGLPDLVIMDMNLPGDRWLAGDPTPQERTGDSPYPDHRADRARDVERSAARPGGGV